MHDPNHELCHRIRVFVYRYHDSLPSYLLLRAAQFESFWTPIHGPIGFGEKLESAIRREVLDDIGLTPPNRLIDLEMTIQLEILVTLRDGPMHVLAKLGKRSPGSGQHADVGNHHDAFRQYRQGLGAHFANSNGDGE